MLSVNNIPLYGYTHLLYVGKLPVGERKHPDFSAARKQLNKNVAAKVMGQGPSQDGCQAWQCPSHCADFKCMNDAREKALDSSFKASESCFGQATWGWRPSAKHDHFMNL